MPRQIVTDNIIEYVDIVYDGTRFALIHKHKERDNLVCIILNPHEAVKISKFIKEQNAKT